MATARFKMFLVQAADRSNWYCVILFSVGWGEPVPEVPFDKAHTPEPFKKSHFRIESTGYRYLPLVHQAFGQGEGLGLRMAPGACAREPSQHPPFMRKVRKVGLCAEPPFGRYELRLPAPRANCSQTRDLVILRLPEKHHAEIAL